jgi:hypothetical protein
LPPRYLSLYPPTCLPLLPPMLEALNPSPSALGETLCNALPASLKWPCLSIWFPPSASPPPSRDCAASLATHVRDVLVENGAASTVAVLTSFALRVASGEESGSGTPACVRHLAFALAMWPMCPVSRCVCSLLKLSQCRRFSCTRMYNVPPPSPNRPCTHIICGA